MQQSVIIQLTPEQEDQLAPLAEEAAMVLGYYWGPDHLRFFPVPEKQAVEFSKLMQRYKEECEKTSGYETEAWNVLHNRPTANSFTDVDNRSHDAAD